MLMKAFSASARLAVGYIDTNTSCFIRVVNAVSMCMYSALQI